METKEYRLTDICDFQGGTQPPKEEWINEPRDGFVRMLQIRDFTQGKEEHIAYVKDTKKLNKCKEDDILIGRYGASVGKILTGLAGAYNVAIIKTIPNEELLSKRYLYYVLTGTDFQNFILNIGARAAQAGFNKNDLSLFKLQIPTSLDDQERIANVLEKAQSLLAKREQSIGLLDEFLKMKFYEMFGDPSKNDKNWPITTFSKLARIDRDSISPDNFTSEDYYIGLEDIEKETGRIVKSSTDNPEELKSSKFRFSSDHILYAKLRPYLNKVALPETKGLCSTDIFPIKAIEGASTKYFVCYLMRSPFFVREMDKKSVGANLPRANPDAINNLKVYKPDLTEQESFSKLCNQCRIIQKSFFQNSHNLYDLFKVLNHRALKGDLQAIERIYLEGTIKVQPKLSGEVIAIDKINKELEEFHISQPHTGAPDEIDNTIRQLETELKIKGEIPFWDEYVKYRIVKGKFKTPFTFDQLWEEITKFPFETVPEYDEVATLLFKWLSEENAFIRQQFNESTKQIELVLNETAKVKTEY